MCKNRRGFRCNSLVICLYALSCGDSVSQNAAAASEHPESAENSENPSSTSNAADSVTPEPSSTVYASPSTQTVDDSEIEQCYRLQVHQESDPNDHSPYIVSAGESNTCFLFEPPWGATEVQAISIRTHTGPLVHHWVLGDNDGGHEAGAVLPDGFACIGSNRQFAAYSRNQQPIIDMPADVGLKMPAGNSGVLLSLNFHYYNVGDAAPDETYVEICTPKAPRPNLAEVVMLGPTGFSLPPHKATAATGTCTVDGKLEANIVRSFPHMHARGRSQDTIIARKDGTRETLINMPFDAGEQLVYDTPATVKPGDRLLTTCHWQNDTDDTIDEGESVDDEMCINFVTVWPVDSLINGSVLGIEGCYH